MSAFVGKVPSTWGVTGRVPAYLWTSMVPASLEQAWGGTDMQSLETIVRTWAFHLNEEK